MKYGTISGTILLLVTVLTGPTSAAPTSGRIVLKVGTLAPRGSTWERIAQDMFQQIELETEGRIRFQLYSGGVLGDDPDMVRKMRLGQLDVGGLTGLGAEEIATETAAIEVPFLFNSLADVDRVRTFVKEELSKAFSRKGFVLLALIDQAGFVHIYSKNRIRTLADLRAQKPWLWAGNRVFMESFKAFAAPSIPLSVPDVLPGLQAGLIDAVTVTPLACVALQWYAHIRYVFKVDFAYQPAVITFTQKSWDLLSLDDQAAVARIVRQYEPILIRVARQDDETALKGMRRRGIEIVLPTEEARREMVEAARAVPEALIAQKLFDREFFQQILHRLGTS